MHQTLFHIPGEKFGLPMFGVGILLAVLVIGAVAGLIWLWRTRGSLDEAWGFVPVVLMMGAAVVFLLPVLVEREGLPIRGYGVMMLAGIVCGVGLAAWRAPAARFDPEVIYALAFWMFICGIAGGRLFHVIEYWDSAYRQPTLGGTLAAIVNVPRGGLVVYGALIAVLIMLPIFVWRHKLPGLALCDLVAPSMVLGLALGRIGCLLNGCCYGGPTDVPWAITFPANSLPYREQRQKGQLEDLQLALDRDRRIVVEHVLTEPARESGLKDGQVVTAIEGEMEGRPIRLDLGAKSEIHFLPSAEKSAAGVQDKKGASDEPPLPPDAQQWIDIQQDLLLSDKPRERLQGVANFLQALSYPDVAVETADGGRFAWKLPARSLPVQPAQIYSTIDAALICIFLLAYTPFRRRDGEVMALMLTIYPITRFLIEIIRVDEKGQFGTDWSISQWVSAGVIIGVAALWVYILRQPKGKLWASPQGVL